VGTVDDGPWPIGVQDAFVPERDCAIVPLRDGALATSSVGGRRWRRGGRTLHHVIDPRTGTSSDSDLHAVTVHAPTAAAAEIAAKVVLILGTEAGSTFLIDRRLAALLTRRDGHQQVVGDFPREQIESNVTFHCA
jgi:thiamine biosynthesis lipoprotein